MLISREEYHRRKGDKKIFGYEDCPFCFGDQRDMTLRVGTYRKILINIAPYTGTTDHIMAIPKEHKRFMTELDHNEIAELPAVFQAVKNIMGQQEYFSFTRETLGNGTRSVEHLHIHYCPGVLQGRYLRKMLQNQGFPIIQEL